jgi:S-ribosylhomocysteine lyase LuxS involved in autoinducer biosynthesis
MTKSFCIDHTKLNPGFYYQETKQGIFIYDWRIFSPREKKYLNEKANHTIEHYLASYLNEIEEYKKVAIFPYGCLTGFGLALGTLLTPIQSKTLLLNFINYVNNTTFIPGNSELECGNHTTLDRNEALKVLKVVESEILTDKYNYIYTDFVQ